MKSFRYLAFLEQEIQSHANNHLLPLAQAHDLLADTRQRGMTLKNRLESERIPVVRPARPRRLEPIVRTPRPEEPRRPLLEIVLDPRSTQWLLACGGALMVFGLVVYLWIAGVFSDPLLAAGVLGAGTLALLLGGWALVLRTRYQVAGRALTLLACLVMPLNLWFYQVQGLLAVEAGGRLWLAALVCCVLYLVSALVLRDELFVYVLVAGLALTGPLLLASLAAPLAHALVAPVTLLVALGLVCVHAERLFPPAPRASGEDEARAEAPGPFTRPRFGMAFYWSGHAVLVVAYTLLLGGHLYSWLRPVLEWLSRPRTLPPLGLVTDPVQQWLALALVLAAVYACLYSDLVVRRVGVYIYFATFAVLWAEVLALNLAAVAVPTEVVILVLAATALAANLLQTPLARRIDAFERSGAPLGLFLSTLPVLLGLVLHLRATNPVWRRAFPYEPGWLFVAAMLATALSCRYGAFLYRRQAPALSALYFFGTAAATLVGAAALLSVLGVTAWADQALVLMLIPIAYLVASRLYRGRTPERPLVWVAHSATGVMLLAALGNGLERVTGLTIDPVTGVPLNLLLAGFWLEAAAFYVLAAVTRREAGAVYLATLTGAAALWQLLSYAAVVPEYQALAFAVLGLALLAAYRFGLLHRFKQEGLEQALFQCANLTLSLACVAAALVAIGRFGDLEGPVWTAAHVRLLGLLAVTVALSGLAVWWVPDDAWRPWYVLVAAGEGLLALRTLYPLLHLTALESLELTAILLGLVLLAAGHVGWYRERDRQSDLVSLCLTFGSLLVGLPLLVAVLCYRGTGQFHAPDEVGLLVAAVGLFGSGVLFHLKATTVVGALLGAVGLLSLALFVRVPSALQTAAAGIAIGGAALFLVGLLLSIYRDRLLALPEHLRRREGVFRVLTWR